MLLKNYKRCGDRLKGIDLGDANAGGSPVAPPDGALAAKVAELKRRLKKARGEDLEEPEAAAIDEPVVEPPQRSPVQVVIERTLKRISTAREAVG